MKINKLISSSVVLFILYVVGFVGSLNDTDWVLRATPIHLLLCFAFFLWNEAERWQLKRIGIGISLFVFGIAIEWFGVHYQWPFGEYYYGDRLGLKIDGIPLTMGLNWLLLGLLSAELSRTLLAKKGILLQSLLGASLMLLTDIPMEQVCARLDFWYWKADSAPLQNYLAWFILGLGVQFLLLKDRKDLRLNPLSTVLYGLQFLFFFSLSIFKNP